jgi:hypothetical protein
MNEERTSKLFFFWPLYCLSFFDIQLLITSLISSNFSCEPFKFLVCCLYPISNKDIAVLSLEDQKAPVLNTRGSREPVFLTWFSIWLLNFIEQVGIFLCNSYVGSRKYFYVCCASSQIKQLYHNKGRFPVKLALVKSAPSQIGLKMKVKSAPKIKIKKE